MKTLLTHAAAWSAPTTRLKQASPRDCAVAVLQSMGFQPVPNVRSRERAAQAEWGRKQAGAFGACLSRYSQELIFMLDTWLGLLITTSLLFTAVLGATIAQNFGHLALCATAWVVTGLLLAIIVVCKSSEILCEWVSLPVPNFIFLQQNIPGQVRGANETLTQVGIDTRIRYNRGNDPFLEASRDAGKTWVPVMHFVGQQVLFPAVS